MDKKRTILEHANDIIFNRSEEKEREYGPLQESMSKASIMASQMTGLEITTDAMYKIMIALKLSRLSYNTKYDTILDAVGYLAGLEDYQNNKKRK